jgi:hypothetical protein
MLVEDLPERGLDFGEIVADRLPDNAEIDEEATVGEEIQSTYSAMRRMRCPPNGGWLHLVHRQKSTGKLRILLFLLRISFQDLTGVQDASNRSVKPA